MRDIGKVALRDRGTFNASVSYEILDIVEYQGYVYCCYTPDTPAGTLPTDSTHFHRWFGSASADNTYQTNDSVENDIDDADYIPFLDSSASAPKRSLWSNLKDKFWTYVQSQLAAVATSGSYEDLDDKPTVDSALSTSSTNAIQNAPVATSMNALNLSLTQTQGDLSSLNSLALKVIWYGTYQSANNLSPNTIAMCNTTVTDLPRQSEMTTVLTILMDANTQFRHQLAIVGSSAAVYTRRMWGGTWSAWAQI